MLPRGLKQNSADTNYVDFHGNLESILQRGKTTDELELCLAQRNTRKRPSSNFLTPQHMSILLTPRRNRPEPSKRHWTDWCEKKSYHKLQRVRYHRRKLQLLVLKAFLRSINRKSSKDDCINDGFPFIQTVEMDVWSPHATHSWIRAQYVQILTISAEHQTYQHSTQQLSGIA